MSFFVPTPSLLDRCLSSFQNTALSFQFVVDMASSAATLTAAPPDEPPGNLSMFQGLWLAPKSDVSVEDPCANASILGIIWRHKIS